MKRIGDLIGFEYRKWERTGKVYVFATEGVELSSIEKIIGIISDLISELNLPLQALNGNATKCDYISLIENLITNNTEEKSISCQPILEELRRHWNEGALLCGLVVLVNPDRYEFRNDPSDPEPAIYGWSDYEGLSILRCFNNKNAVRHEVGHMVRLGSHHEGCAMDWNCSVHEFCENCRRVIDEIWELP